MSCQEIVGKFCTPNDKRRLFAFVEKRMLAAKGKHFPTWFELYVKICG